MPKRKVAGGKVKDILRAILLALTKWKESI